MAESAWANPHLAAAHLQAAVLDLEAMGCKTLEYRSANPKYHMVGSRHNTKTTLGRRCAADVNRDGNGSEAERVWFEKYGQHIAFGHGLSVVCGIYGYVANHSGSNMHLHIDDGKYTNLGNTPSPIRTPAAARPVLPPWPVRAFQKSKGLVVDGIPGPLTTKALRKSAGLPESGKLDSDFWKVMQKRIGVVADGVAGPITYGNLGLAIEHEKI